MANLADIRYNFAGQLADPNTRNALFALTKAETGGQGLPAQQAFIETLLNRATARGQTLPNAIYDRNYYPKQTFDNMRGGVPAAQVGQYGTLLDAVLGGSDLTKGGTGNASGNVMFAGGPQTLATGGERFGVEGPDRGWQSRAQPAPNPYGPEGLNAVGPNGPQDLSLMKFGSPDAQAVPPGEQGTGGGMMALGVHPTGGGDAARAAGLAGAAGTQNQGGLNPMVMMGLGLLTSGMEGKDFSKGLMSGANAAQGFEQNRLTGLKGERDWQIENLKLPLQLQQAQQQLELGKLNIDQAKRQFVPNIGADAYGMPTPGFIDPVNMKVYGLNGQPLSPNGMGGVGAFGGGGATGPTVGGGQPDFSKTGDEFIKTLPPTLAREIQGYVEGRNVLSPAQMRGPAGEAKLRMIMQADPSYDYTAAPARMALRKSYEGGGKQFQELQAVSTVAGHLHDLKDAADKLNNFGGLSVLNYPLNAATGAIRAASQDPRVNDFQTVKSAVMNELAKAYRGGTVSDSSVKEFSEGLSSASTPEQMKTVIGRLNSLLMSKRQALEEGYKGVMGNVTLPQNFSTVNDRTRKLFEDVDSWSTGIKPKDAPTAGAPQAAHPAAASAVGDVVDGALFGHPGERYKRTANGFERVK
jgi:hypothetical protein